MVSVAPAGKLAIVKTNPANSLTFALLAASLEMYSRPALGASVTSTLVAPIVPSLATTTA